LDLVGIPLGLLMYLGTVSPVLHCLGLTRISLFHHFVALLLWLGEEDYLSDWN